MGNQDSQDLKASDGIFKGIEGNGISVEKLILGIQDSQREKFKKAELEDKLLILFDKLSYLERCKLL